MEMLSSLPTANPTAAQLVKDLHSPNPRIYWTDILLTASTGWIAFAFAAVHSWTSWPAWIALAVSAPALYRGLSFLHEIVHLRGSLLRRFGGPSVEARQGVERALEQEQDCTDLLRTIAACRGAMNGLMAEVIEGHIRFHLVDPDKNPTSEEARAARELMDVVHSYLK